MTDSYQGREGRERWRKRKRRRRVVRGFIKLVFWSLVLAGVFVLGLGFGKTIADGSGSSGDTESVTLKENRGVVTATLPVKTVVSTKTVTKTVTKKPPQKRKKSGGR